MMSISLPGQEDARRTNITQIKDMLEELMHFSARYFYISPIHFI